MNIKNNCNDVLDFTLFMVGYVASGSGVTCYLNYRTGSSKYPKLYISYSHYLILFKSVSKFVL